MPYVKQEIRDRNDAVGKSGRHPAMQNAGELNYEITLKLKKYLKTNGISYKTINDIVGALESAKIEFYRRVVVSYEEKKIFENGDVYDT
jgi:hypothetical protein